jgi:8-oxo-dGTP pyrophosphatase MutT (NUDIX family)
MCVLADELKRAKIKNTMANLNTENKRRMDVVDDNDKVVGSKSREEIHRLGLLHRDVHVWMFDMDHNIFFQKRGVSVMWAGLLDATVGGHLNVNESYINAALRETKEETGITVTPDDLIFLKKFKSIMPVSKEEFPGVVNNFFRHLYIYKNPVSRQDIQAEKGILGMDFEKLSIDFLENLKSEDEKTFAECVLAIEIPEVIKYLRALKDK